MKPKRPIVLGIGLSRTGTTKLAEILSGIGYHTAHFLPPLFPFDARGRAREPDWDIVRCYDPITDSPVSLLVRDIASRFVDAKLILTTRPMDSWFESMEWMMFHGRIIWKWGPQVDAYHRSLYGCIKFDRTALEESFPSYHDMVYDTFDINNENIVSIDIENDNIVENMCGFIKAENHVLDVDSVVNPRRKTTVAQRIEYALMQVRWKMDRRN